MGARCGLFAFRNLWWGAAFAIGLFYSPLSAQDIFIKEPIGLEFGIGVKTTLLSTGLLNDLTHANMSRGGFVESRLCVSSISRVLVRVRAAEIHSMDNKGLEEISWSGGGPGDLLQGQLIKSKRRSAGGNLSFLTGWRF